MTTQLQATGVVLSSNPVTTLTADLVNHEVVLTTHGYVVRVGGQKLLDLIRFAQLAANTEIELYPCWRCDTPFSTKVGACPICLHAAHCNACNEWLHSLTAMTEPS